MRAELLSIGTELLLGQIVDTNAAYLARRLSALGIDCLYISTVGDNLARAREAIERALGRSDLVVTTGGLGPTEDDLTREAIAAACGEETVVDPALEAELREWFAARAVTMPERNRKQAWLIPSARALPNPLGTAPGWLVEKDERRIVAMPGVPREMTRMWEVEVEPRLVAGAVLRSRTLKLLGLGESLVEERLADVIRSTAPTLATYAKDDGVHIRLTDKGPAAAEVDARIARLERVVRERLGDHVWGVDDDTIASVVAASLERRGWRVATAEALTAGDVARALAGEALAGRYAGGAVRARGDAAALFTSIADLEAEVRLAVPSGDGETTIVVRLPDAERTAAVRFGSLAEGRRRGALAALDLLRRSIA